MFIYICPFCFEFIKNQIIGIWKSFIWLCFYCGRLLVICGGLRWFVVVCWWFVVVACFSNFVLQCIFFFRKTNLIRITISIEKLLLRSRYFYAASNFQNSYFSRKLILQKRYFLRTPTFSEKLLFETADFSGKQCSATYFSRRGTFTQLNFISTARLLIYMLMKFTLVSNVQ